MLFYVNHQQITAIFLRPLLSELILNSAPHSILFSLYWVTVTFWTNFFVLLNWAYIQERFTVNSFLNSTRRTQRAIFIFSLASVRIYSTVTFMVFPDRSLINRERTWFKSVSILTPSLSIRTNWCFCILNWSASWVALRCKYINHVKLK